MGGGGRKHGARAVAGGRGHAAAGIAIERQTLDVERAAADAFVGFFGTPDAERELFAFNAVGIEQAGGVTGGDGDEVAEVDQRIYRIERLALEDAARQLLAGGAIARGVFAAGFVGSAGGSDAGMIFDCVGGVASDNRFSRLHHFLPKSRRSGTIEYMSFDGNAKEVRDAGRKIGRLDY